MKHETDHILLKDETTERIAAIRSDQVVEPIASLGVPACPTHAWSDNGHLAFPVRHGRRVQLWSVEDENARRLATRVAPVDVRAIHWFRDRFLVGGRARDGHPPLWTGHIVGESIEWQPVEPSADIAQRELPIGALDTCHDSVVAGLGSNLLVRLEIHDNRAQLCATYHLPNTPDATLCAVRTGRDLCAVWTKQWRRSCHPRPSVATWNSVTVHRIDSLALVGAVDVPDDLVDLAFSTDSLLLLASTSASSYAVDELRERRSDAAEEEHLWGAPQIEARRRDHWPGFLPSHLRRSSAGVAWACGNGDVARLDAQQMR